MNSFRCVTVCLLLCTFAASATGAQPIAAARDGQHDFDFHFGSWKTHISSLRHTASGTPYWVTMDGTVIVRKIWDGRANLEEVKADGEGAHFEGTALFLYDPKAHQWSINSARSADGAISPPPTVGQFKDGRGEFFDQELQNGKSVLVRMVWSNITPDSHRFEQAFSSDGGRTWETNFTASLTRADLPPAVSTSAAASSDPADPDGQDAFEFAQGTWREHTSRLLHPLTGSHAWIQMDGVSVDKPIWNGRANVVELESDGPSGHLELLSLRLYNPQSRQWNLYFATSPVGVLSDAMTGDFHNGHGEFFAQTTVNGRTVLARFTVAKLSDTSALSEQAFSADGGKTWEVNWINRYTRAG
jgi:hypothetical protein